jgi:hypothetical protein
LAASSLTTAQSDNLSQAAIVSSSLTELLVTLPLDVKFSGENFTWSNYLLNLYFDIHTRRQVQAHEHIDGFGIGIQNIDQRL